jgi:hypothetical protein
MLHSFHMHIQISKLSQNGENTMERKTSLVGALLRMSRFHSAWENGFTLVNSPRLRQISNKWLDASVTDNFIWKKTLT